MTVQSLDTVTSPAFTPNGVTTVFPFDFEVSAEEEVGASLDGVVLSPSLYSVTLNDDGTGSATFFVAPVGAELLLYADPSFLQPTNFENQGAYFQSTIQRVVDRLARRLIWLKNNTVQKDPGAAAISFPASTDGLTLLGYDESGLGPALIEAASFQGEQGVAGPPGNEVATAASARPAFVEQLATGTIPDQPDNARTGLSGTLMTGGGYVEELQIAVTGTAGSKVLTSGQTTKVAGLGTDPFDVALNSTDGTEDFFATVRSNNGSTTITLDRALERNFTGTLSSRNAGAFDQHITQGATRALAEYVARETGLFCSRGATLDAEWLANGANGVTATNTRWQTNAALRAYNFAATGSETTPVNSAAPIVQTTLAIRTLDTNYAVGNIPILPTPKAGSGAIIGTHAVGHGGDRQFNLNGKPAVIEFWTAAWRDASVVLTNTALAVTVTVDGQTIYSDTPSDLLRRHRVYVGPGGSSGTLSVSNGDGAVYNIEVSQFSIREPGATGRLRGKRVVTLMDSWGAYYDGLFATVLAAKTGATVVNHSLGGMTSEWALAWFDEYVRDEKPDAVVMNFSINDMNALAGNFTTPSGGSQALWPYAVGAASHAALKKNIAKLAQKCAEHGIHLIYLLPPAVASLGQTQSLMEARWYLDAPLITGAWPEEVIPLTVGDETTALTTGTAKLTFRMPYAFRVSAARGSLSTAQTGGSVVTVDVNEAGTSILSTKLTFDNGEKTTGSAATPLVLSDYALADDAEITVDIDQVGDGTAKGLKVTLYGRRIG